jgi:hypothetical protein
MAYHALEKRSAFTTLGSCNVRVALASWDHEICMAWIMQKWHGEMGCGHLYYLNFACKDLGSESILKLTCNIN